MDLDTWNFEDESVLSSGFVDVVCDKIFVGIVPHSDQIGTHWKRYWMVWNARTRCNRRGGL